MLQPETGVNFVQNAEFSNIVHEIYYGTEDPLLKKQIYNVWSPGFGTLIKDQKVSGYNYSFQKINENADLRESDIDNVFIRTSDGLPVVRLTSGLYVLEQQITDTDYVFDSELGGLSSEICRVHSPEGDRVLKVLPPPSPTDISAEAEYEATVVLAQAGYPVAQKPRVERLFYPWLDTFSYEWVEGVPLDEQLEVLCQKDIREAQQLMTRFGEHLKTVWADLLDGKAKLPGGKTYSMSDTTITGFIYTGKEDIRDAFVKIDLMGLDDEESVGFLNKTKEIEQEITRFLGFNPSDQKKLLEAFKLGIGSLD